MSGFIHTAGGSLGVMFPFCVTPSLCMLLRKMAVLLPGRAWVVGFVHEVKSEEAPRHLRGQLRLQLIPEN